jgi:endonuclease YncB( thermonuclease family)
VVLLGVTLSACTSFQEMGASLERGWARLKGTVIDEDAAKSQRPVDASPQKPAAQPTAALPALLPFEFSGTAAEVVDGDTIVLAGMHIRLHGIDAPEYAQPCRKNGLDLPCGVMATNTLIGFTAGQILTCVQVEMDRYGRIVARCKAGTFDLGEGMVSAGMAVAYREYSDDYVMAESAARSRNNGIWATEFIMPWDWRRGARRP